VKKDPEVAARPTCLFCRKPLRPVITTDYRIRSPEDHAYFLSPPVAFSHYGDGRSGDRFCGQLCGFRWACHIAPQRKPITDEQKLRELERARARYEQAKARGRRKKFHDQIDADKAD
jgi:hypothetical protein